MRTNTLSIEIVDYNKRIQPYQAHCFIQEKFKLCNEDVVSIGMYGNKVMLKVAKDDILEKIFDEWEDKLKFEDDEGRIFEVKLVNENSKKMVKIHRCPVEVPSTEIEKVLSAYGTIDEIRNDVWINLPYKCFNDTKLVRMEIRKPIPSYVQITGKQYWLTYTGQNKTCRRCDSIDHEARDCSLSIVNRFRQRNYADAVSKSFKKAMILDREAMMEENFTPLGEKQYLKAKPARKEDDGQEGSTQLKLKINEKEIEQPVLSTSAHDLNRLESNEVDPEGERVQNGQGVVEIHDSEEVSHTEELEADTLQGKSSESRDEDWKKQKGRKRGKGSSSPSSSESGNQSAKKINWADEVGDTVDVNGQMEVETENAHNTRKVLRQSSEESSY